RNAGIELATGEYLGFVDCDDYIADDMYETLYNQIVTYEAVLATVGMIDVYENRESRLTDKKEIIILSQNEAIQAVLDSTDVNA
ncbi:glycosyltransferase, partial [Enterococcus faecalis]|uniref:glycosyltransferase n=1 Tax=Enterococcus faecalis TaxID=1351 RepID=UPI003CC64BFA